MSATRPDSKDVKFKVKFGPQYTGSNPILPDSLVIEQASSWVTSRYVASLLGPDCSVADLTGGLGVNSFQFALIAKKVFCIEIEKHRAEAIRHNFIDSKITNVDVINADCINWLRECKSNFDIAFVDPSRRSADGKKLVSLQDCTPDFNEVFPLLPPSCNKLIIKASPLLDITDLFRTYDSLNEIRIVEYKREVKELLLVFDRDGESSQRVDRGGKKIICAILSDSVLDRELIFDYAEKSNNSSFRVLSGKEELSEGDYVYEPSPAIMKSGMFGVLLDLFPELKKLDNNTHLFSSKEYIEGFPGRSFKTSKFLTSKDLKRLKGQKYNVISRNHPAKAAELEARFRLIPDEYKYLMACRIAGEKVIIEAVKR